MAPSTHIQVRDNIANVGIFDLTCALDTQLSDTARGLLFRTFALRIKHIWIHGQSVPFRISLEDLARIPDGIDAVRASLRELHDQGYVRRWKEDDEWFVELAETTFLDEAPIADITPIKTKKPIIKKRQVSKKRAGYEEVLFWLTSPAGGDYAIAGKEWGRVVQSINTILDLAVQRKWLELDDQGQLAGGDADNLVHYISECWQWILEGTPYRGKQDIHSVAKNIQQWWTEEGKGKYGRGSDVSYTHAPSLL